MRVTLTWSLDMSRRCLDQQHGMLCLEIENNLAPLFANYNQTVASLCQLHRSHANFKTVSDTKTK